MATTTNPQPQIEAVTTTGKESEPTPVVVASNYTGRWPMTPGLPYIARDEKGEPLDPSGQAYGDRG